MSPKRWSVLPGYNFAGGLILMTELTTAYIGLGSNLGDRAGQINKALEALKAVDGIRLIAVSRLYETLPLAGSEQGNYINAVAKVETSLTAEDFFAKLGEIEDSLGRVKGQNWSSRTIDLDLLIFGRQIIDTARLTVPHKQMHLRSFVLSGLCELNAGLIHPVLNEPVNELTARLNGGDFFLNGGRVQLISIAGLIGAGKTTLAQALAKQLSCEVLLEPYDKNPFLPQVYAGKKELALDCQLFFLNERTRQLDPKRLETGRVVISDYIFDKELIYARRLLDVQQLASYEKSYASFSGKVTLPVLVIYLQLGPEQCLERIHKRNRPYEQRIDMEFLRDLHYDYRELFAEWKASPVIRLDIADFDYADSKNIGHLIKQIKSYIVI
jgi:2-amino-4-hydroxy-6-hydroxymethyldihydropteridine diphosphokinase